MQASLSIGLKHYRLAHGLLWSQCDHAGQEADWVGGLTFNGEILKVKNLMGAPSNPIPLVKRSSEQFLFLKLDIWKALM